jgi:PAS domain S-box-containing protein
VRDITERKKAEAQLLASEQLFRALVENSPDFIARYDQEFRRIYVNPAIQKLFEVSVENVLGTTPVDHSPVYAPQVYMDHLRQVLETATENSMEMPYRTVQGEMRWGHMRFAPEFGPDGSVDSVLAIGRDIHEIKENEQRFRMLAENFPDFVIRFDRDGRYTYVNPAFEKAFGMPAESIIGKTLQELPQRSKAKQTDTPLALIRHVFDEGIATESEAYWDTEMGECIFENRYVPEKDAAGNVVNVLCIARDVTEQKQAEAEINKLNQELEQRVVDRTAQLEAANKELEAFAYSVSHDLRAPLRHIDGFIELLQNKARTLLDEKGQHYMTMIADSAGQMGKLIDDLLSFSRMGRNEMITGQVDLGGLVDEVVRQFGPETENRNVEWNIAGLPLVRGDRSMLKIVFTNLISNALKFTRPREHPRIEIGSSQDLNEAVISISDNGVGFDMEYADKLFGVFQRLHRQEDFEGTGIGLANVRRIVNRHGGRTWAEGKVDCGATFYLSLPQSIQEQSSTKEAKPEAKAG